MKQLTIISGKGGTGKTTITAAFACYAENAVLADADVDAADLHLILEPTIRHEEPFVGGSVGVINKELCTECGMCVEHCRYDAIHDFTIDPVACEGCRLCTQVCPEGAAQMEEKVSGTCFVSSTRMGDMVHARLGIAEDNSGKLVSHVRQKAKALAEEKGKELVITDGPPGIGCPVIASITGADLVLIVTEPTISGIHDLERVVETAEHFKIPALVCINKYDINAENTQAIQEYCRGKGVTVAGSIPYDRCVTDAMIHKRSVAEHACGDVSEAVRKTWNGCMQALCSN